MTIAWGVLAAIAGAAFIGGRATATTEATNWQLAVAVAAGALGGFLLAKAVSQ
jgi:hypothetical protein